MAVRSATKPGTAWCSHAWSELYVAVGGVMYGLSSRPLHLSLGVGALCHQGFDFKRRYALRSYQDLWCQLTVHALSELEYTLMHSNLGSVTVQCNIMRLKNAALLKQRMGCVLVGLDYRPVQNFVMCTAGTKHILPRADASLV